MIQVKGVARDALAARELEVDEHHVRARTISW